MFFIKLILVFCYCFCLGFSRGRVDGVAAVVGKNVVLHSDVVQQAQFVALERQVDPSKNPFLFEQIYFDTRDNIINQYVILSIAEKDTNFVVSGDEVDRALDQQIEEFIARAGSEKAFLEMAGMSMRQIKADYWKNIRDMMVVERYRFNKIQTLDVSRDEVRAFYNTYKDSIPPLPEQYDFSIIERPFIAGIDSENKTISFLDSLKNNIENNGFSFDSLAQIYSQDPGSAPLGGHLGYTTRGSLVGGFEEAAYSLFPGDISYPVKTDFGYHLIRLIDRQGEKISTQHILRTLVFSEEDKNVVYSSINQLAFKIDNNSPVFDSIANVFSNEYNNYSGKYLGYAPNDIPDDILLNLRMLEDFEVSAPIETDNSLLLIYYYNHQKKTMPTLLNSWNLIYNYSKQKKQNDYFQNWINKIKNEVYIKIINE